jgi:hypothetical protein
MMLKRVGWMDTGAIILLYKLPTRRALLGLVGFVSLLWLPILA